MLGKKKWAAKKTLDLRRLILLLGHTIIWGIYKMMKLVIHGATKKEIDVLIERLDMICYVISVSKPYPNRYVGDPLRVYVDISLDGYTCSCGAKVLDKFNHCPACGLAKPYAKVNVGVSNRQLKKIGL